MVDSDMDITVPTMSMKKNTVKWWSDLVIVS